MPIVRLAEMQPGQEADVFLLLAGKEELTTKTGKPYFRVTFRDATQEVSFPIWSDSGWAQACRDQWNVGEFYKVRGAWKDSSYGPQLEIHKIRPVQESDRRDGFDETRFHPASRHDPSAMFDELVGLAEREIHAAKLSALVVDILRAHRDQLLTLPAATRNHHAFVGGFLEHVLSVAKSVLWLADKYRRDYPDLRPPISRDLCLAGAILHDIGKLRELEMTPAGGAYMPAGELIGHVLLGRDIVREFAQGRQLDEETRLRLEHIIVSHQRLPEWGSPKPPMTPEAVIVHFADDLDAKLHIVCAALADEPGDGPFTSSRNSLGHRMFRGLG